jgi:hypothetical protein
MSSLEPAVPKLWLFDEQKMNPPFSMLDIYIPRRLDAGYPQGHAANSSFCYFISPQQSSSKFSIAVDLLAADVLKR